MIAEDVTEILFRPADYFSEYTQDIPSRMTISALNPAHQGSGVAIDFLITGYEYTLSISSFEGPEAVLPGADISNVWIIVNPHDSPITNTQGATAGLYLSEDYYFDPQSDILLGGNIPLPEQMNAIFRLRPENIFIPGNTPPGDYYLIVVLDNQNHFIEANEEDNIGIVEIRVEDPATTLPNLRISYLNCPSEIEMNRYMRDEFTLRYENTGLIPVHPWPEPVVVGLYISEDRFLDDTDTLITYSQQEIQDPIEPGIDTLLEWDHMFYLPSGFTPGHYYLLAKIDDTEILTEREELDNVYLLPIEVLPE